MSLLVLPEDRVDRLETLARFSQNLFTLERALATTPDRDPSDLADFDWAWVRTFDADDIGEFVTAMRQALLMSMHDDRSNLPETVLEQWRITAQSLSDSVRRSILLEPLKSKDFVEAHRPEAVISKTVK